MPAFILTTDSLRCITTQTYFTVRKSFVTDLYLSASVRNMVPKANANWIFSYIRICITHKMTSTSTIGSCYSLNVCAPQNLCVEILTPNVRVLGGRVWGKWSGHESRALMNGISALTKGDPQSSLRFLPCEEVCSPEEGPHWPMLAPWSQTSSLWSCEK